MKSDDFYPLSLVHLMEMIQNEYRSHKSIFGIPAELFWQTPGKNPLKLNFLGKSFENPLGVAAGPHTQLSQNIVAAWLTGARIIELKTVQVLDNLTISKPCIDMFDEGYNCEWSQELPIDQSINQYIDAWIVIHWIHRVLMQHHDQLPGVLFNMSVGYNLEGIKSEKIHRFIQTMKDASEIIEQKICELKPLFPEITNIDIPKQISESVTLSTMHGCPPQEIESIATYLMRTYKIHTFVKLNPTLAGKEFIDNFFKKSKFKTTIPDAAFEHDIDFPTACGIINNLRNAAKETGVEFGVKLTNTLESVNNRSTFSSEEKSMYMSGRALHPIAIEVACRLQHYFGGDLTISFSGGANYKNFAWLLKCGFKTVTVCSDLLKPGGYLRLRQYLETAYAEFEKHKATTIDEFIKIKIENSSSKSTALENLLGYSKQVANDHQYHRTYFKEPNIKTPRPLGFFDCIAAPCRETCPTEQDIPTYNYFVSEGQFGRALEIIRQTNPFPHTTGLICDHQCQAKCTRIHYDSAVEIRAIKRAATEYSPPMTGGSHSKTTQTNKKVAIVGAGPSGLSAAYFLLKAGFSVTLFEKRDRVGGMISNVIPFFRMPNQALESDIHEIEKLGAIIHYNTNVDRQRFSQLIKDYDYVYLACGAQKSVKLNIPGADSEGVIDALEFLHRCKNGQQPLLNGKVIIIGGGNTAMDVARTAKRLISHDGKVTIVYRRTIEEMPADLSEIKMAINENIEIIELVSPIKIESLNGRVVAITCQQMYLGEPDKNGRRKPMPLQGSFLTIEADTIIPAIGQDFDFDFEIENPNAGTYQTGEPKVFIGGDALHGASTAIVAIGDGRKVAQTIIDRELLTFSTNPQNVRESQSQLRHIRQRGIKIDPIASTRQTSPLKVDYALTFTQEEAMAEAQRCLLCDEYCSICSTVCPNLANVTYKIKPQTLARQRLIAKGKTIEIETMEPFVLRQNYQIANIDNFCNECGNCATFCPTSGEPYRQKPKVALTYSLFCSIEGRYFLKYNPNPEILYKESGVLYSLKEEPGHFIFQGDAFALRLSKNDLSILDYTVSENTSLPVTNEKAITMKILLEGLKNLTFKS